MDEKTSDPSTATSDPTVAVDPDESNAGNVTPTQDELLPADAGTAQTSESTEEESIVDASLISTDTNHDVVENNLNPNDDPSVQTAISEANDDKIEINETSEIGDEIVPTMDSLEDAKSTEAEKEPENAELPTSEPMEIEPPEEKTEQVEPHSAVYELEEELKRLHGDTSEETKTDSFMGDLSVSTILDDTVDTTAKPENLDNVTSKSTSLMNIRKFQDDKPIMKDSDLEEMLSAGDVIKDPVLIREAQEDLKATDILVCGRCHEVYHFLEEYQNHKNHGCTAKSTILPICEGESKPQVWGFTLWKTKQNKSLKPGEPVPTSWRTYQKWCKLAPLEKNAWISAGQTIQFCHKVATAKVVEIKSKPQANADKDPLALDSIESNKENSNIDNSMKTAKTTVKSLNSESSIKSNDANTNSAIRTPNKGSEKSEFAVERIVAKRFNPKKKCWEYQIKWEHFPSDQNTWEPLSNLTHCKKLVDNFEEQLRKLKADKAKQVGISKSRNSSVLSTSSVESSTGRPQRSSKQKALNQVKAWCGNISDDDGMGLKRKLEDDDSDDSFEKKLKTEDFSDDSDFDLNSLMNTPSKTPALRKIQQKPAQAGVQIFKNGLDKSGPLPHNILIPDANGVVRINQKQLPSLSTGVYIMSKTAGIIKLDSTTSKVAASGGQTIVKVAPKIGQTQIKIVKKDGSTTATTKQVLPSISNTSTPIVTKVYKPVITKVKKPAESPKKTPEIVRKTIEVTRKPEVKKISPAEVKKQLDTPKSVPPQSKIIKKEEPKKTLTSMMDMSAPEDDSDDGLEELPFPEDIKIPEPESPPSEFTLDPITGKIAGMEYPEKPEVEEPEQEPEPTEETKSDTSLDNIVKLAAADITEDDLKNDDPMEVESMAHEDQEEEEEELLHIPEKKTSLIRNEPMTATGMSKTIVRMPVGATNRLQAKQPQRQGSILNKVLTGTPIIRRTAVPGGVQKVQQRVVNQSVLKNTYGTIVRVGNTTYVRKSPGVKKTRPFVPSPTTRVIRAQHEPAAKNVYTYSRQVVQGGPRKIGNTTIRQAASLDMIAQQQKLASSQSLIANRPGIHPGSTPIVRRVVHGTTGNAQSPVKKDFLIRQQQEQQRKVVMPTRSSKPVHQIQHQPLAKPKAVINMPSLLGDDESEADPSPPELTKTTSPPPFTTTVMSTPAGLLESSTMGESMSESMQEAMAEQSEETMEHQNTTTTEADGAGTVTDLSSFTLTDNENPIFITGDDGTVYQVAGQNEQGQTILLTQGSDGQQQCLLVTSEVAEAMEAAAEQPEQPAPEVSPPEVSENLTEPLSIKTEADTNDQVVAQVVRAEPPSPGGTHKVVVMLPDGNLMVTQVSPEEYASLELE